jgi:serine/threonine-protein kinase
MSLGAGSRLGPYEIVTLLGAGGMGEVYRARDTRLNRDVALKILPDAFANDAERLARFTREAQTLAALNHPNIAHIHGLEESGGVRALVMELVEGDDLSVRIARGPLALDEALPMARQIVEALQTAHEQGIVHRDLKPANIKVRPDGVVKVLDFGLAKLAQPESAGGLAEVTASPTITSPARMTAVGVILGTAAYMSPEQTKGREADRRSDIWAFGCVLYEMLTGKRAFDAGSVQATLAAVITTDPDWTILPTAVPTALPRLLRRCLNKDPKRRLPHIAVALLEIDDALLVDSEAIGAGARDGSARRIAWPRLWQLVGVGMIAAVLGGLTTWAFRRPPTGTPSAVARFAMTLPSALALRNPLDASALAVSSDGTRLVYVADPQSRLVVRAFEQLDDVPLPGIVDARDPFFSADGGWVGFFDSGVALRRVSIRGGPPALVCRVSGAPRGASWAHGDTIVFATSDTSTGLLSVPAGGGEPKVLTKPNAQDGEQDHSFPSVLPGGRSVLFTIENLDRSESSAVTILDLETGRYKRLLRGGRAEYLETGHVIYQDGRTLWAVGFDLDTASLRRPGTSG